jgi:hypothetical protein
MNNTELPLKSRVKKLLDAAEDDFDTISEFFQGDMQQTPSSWMLEHRASYEEHFQFLDFVCELGLTFEFEDRYGGEGQGDEYWSVYKFSLGEEVVYVKFDGWYASYNGSEFNEWFFVEPQEKVVTVFNRV